MDVGLFSSCSHVTIKTRNVYPRAEGGARILIKESSIKAIEKCRDASSLEKSSTDNLKFYIISLIVITIVEFKLPNLRICHGIFLLCARNLHNNIQTFKSMLKHSIIKYI